MRSIEEKEREAQWQSRGKYREKGKGSAEEK